MPRTVGYMLTWTTYGSWLQGDVRGYVKNSRILPDDKKLVDLCVNSKKQILLGSKTMKGISSARQYLTKRNVSA